MVETVGRVFVAVPLPDDIRMALADEVSGLNIPGKLVPPENWHITLRFLGAIDIVPYERFLAFLGQSALPESFSIRLGRLDAFPNPRRATVVWVGLSSGSPSLVALNETTEDAAQSVGLEPEERPFRPHVTLARVRPQQDVAYLLDHQVDLAWKTKEIVLFKTKLIAGRSTYERLESFAL